MTERVRKMLDFMLGRSYRKVRREYEIDVNEIYKTHNLSELIIENLIIAASKEKPLIYDGDIFGFNRYARCRLKFDRVGEDKDNSNSNNGNFTLDYQAFLSEGLDGIKARIENKRAKNAIPFYDGLLRILEIFYSIADSQREEAKRIGNRELYEALCIVPHGRAQTYYQALVSLKFLHYACRLSDANHLGLGRMDVYLRPLYENDIKNGKTKEELLELTELFFISLNMDTDLYAGIQQGDNGQSVMLGGMTQDGGDAYCELTDVILTASEELCLIDPKINVRVNKNTPVEIYEKCTRLTKQGLGFPQYSNDDIVIPGLVALGYSEEDARDYTVAACWEFVIPGKGAEIPNMCTMNFPLVIERATDQHLSECETFEEFLAKVDEELKAEAESIMAQHNKRRIRPQPVLSLLVNSCIERGKDVGEGGAIYNNFGMHGAGISTAADALCAIKRACYEDKIVERAELINALKNDYNGYEQLQKELLAYPKMGNNIDEVDQLSCFLMERFGTYVNGKPNQRGGIYRAGTGSAMEYWWSARKVGATADGRRAYAPYASSFSPSLNARLDGPLSTIASFTKFDMKKIINGGPLTIEIHDGVFRNEIGEKKVALLVKTFIDRGGHQLQLNAINRETLLDAQAHPEKYPNLVVRVWGWSGYFTELDLDYQNHILMRTQFNAN